MAFTRIPVARVNACKSSAASGRTVMSHSISRNVSVTGGFCAAGEHARAAQGSALHATPAIHDFDGLVPPAGERRHGNNIGAPFFRLTLSPETPVPKLPELANNQEWRTLHVEQPSCSPPTARPIRRSCRYQRRIDPRSCV